MTYKELYVLMENLKKIYHDVRLIDPYKDETVTVDEDGNVSSSGKCCYSVLGRERRCDNCISVKACKQKEYQEKYEISDENIYHFSASNVEVEGKNYALEILANVHDNVIVDAYGKGQFSDILYSINHKLYIDPLTQVYNRRYYEEYYADFSEEMAVAIVDVDDFKHVNDEHGHSIGDVALRRVADSIKSQVRTNDVVIRFGGDEFLIVFHDIPKEVFVRKMDTIRQVVAEVSIPGALGLKVTISIGCSYKEGDKVPTLDEADTQLYLAKIPKNKVAIDEDASHLHDRKTLITDFDTDIPASYEEIANDEAEVAQGRNLRDYSHVMRAFSGDYNSILKVNLEDNSISVYQVSGENSKWISNAAKNGYDEYRRAYAEKFLFSEDREWFMKNTEKGALMERFAFEDIFYINHRIIKNGVINYYQSKFVKDITPGGFVVLIGGHSIDAETRRIESERQTERFRNKTNDMIAKLAREYEGIYLANIDTGEVMPIRSEGIAADFEQPEYYSVEGFDDITLVFARDAVIPEDREKYIEFMNRDNIRKMCLMSDENHSMNFRVNRNGKTTFYQVVISGNAPEVSGMWITIGVRNTDDAVRETTLKKEREAVISLFSRSYDSLGIIDTDADTVEVFKNGAVFSTGREVSVGDVFPYTRLKNAIIESYVVPEDREFISNLIEISNLRERFSGSEDLIQAMFNVETAKGRRRFEVSIGKLQESKEKNRAFIGVTNAYERIEARAALKDAEEDMRIANAILDIFVTEPDADRSIDNLLENIGKFYQGVRAYVYELDYDTGYVKYENEWLAESKYTQLEDFQHVKIEDLQFWIDEIEEYGIYTFNDPESPAAKQTLSYKLLGRSDLTGIVASGVYIDGELAAIIGVDNPKRNIDRHFPIKTVATLVYGEITKKKRIAAEAEAEHAEELERLVAIRTEELKVKSEELAELNDEIINSIGTIVEARDLESGKHTQRVKHIVEIIARDVMENYPEYALNEERVDLIAKCSPLHDVGKIAISDTILLKPGRLTEEEFEVMKTHCVRGCEIIEKSPVSWDEDFRRVCMQICRWHHERYDGNGYPDGLKGEEIPVSAQIVAIADCYDAMTSERVYKSAMTTDEAFETILNGGCGVFSRQMMDSFKRCRDKLKI